MIDYAVFAFPKGPTRRETKIAKHAVEQQADRAARAMAWSRCRGRCEDCRRRVKRGGGLIDGAHFHHCILRSRGGRKTPIYLVLCASCHFDGPSGAHTRSR